MKKDGNKMAENVLNLTLEIIFQLTGEDYTVVKKTSSDGCRAPVCEGGGKVTGPPPRPLIHEDIHVQKILEAATKMIELLTGEVTIRCQNVAVYFSMEEWEYLEGHKDLYKEAMMETRQPLTSPGVGIGSSARRLISADCKAGNCDITQVTHEEPAIITDVPSISHSKDPSSGTSIQLPSSDSSLIDKNKSHKRKEYQSTPTGEKLYSCSECEKSFTYKSSLSAHQRIHTGEQLFSCSECEKCFTSKSHLLVHHRSHTGEKPFSCSICGTVFSVKSHLNRHQRRHAECKTFPCSECGKCFTDKVYLERHQKVHIGEKPYSCSECGKCFLWHSVLKQHMRGHTGEKPYLCQECGKCFARRKRLVEHQRVHTGVKPYACSECGKCFIARKDLARHERTHTGERPYSCAECGKNFTRKEHLVEHQKIHTGEQPLSCSECGKQFKHKCNLLAHQKRSHKGK